jgi:hypothetical protein
MNVTVEDWWPSRSRVIEVPHSDSILAYHEFNELFLGSINVAGEVWDSILEVWRLDTPSFTV